MFQQNSVIGQIPSITINPIPKRSDIGKISITLWQRKKRKITNIIEGKTSFPCYVRKVISHFWFKFQYAIHLFFSLPLLLLTDFFLQKSYFFLLQNLLDILSLSHLLFH